MGLVLLEQGEAVTNKKTTIHLGRSLQHIKHADGRPGQLDHGGQDDSAAHAECSPSPEMLKAEYDRGRDEARRELAHAYAALNALVAGVKKESSEMLQVIDRHATVLGLQIARKVIGKEVQSGAVVQGVIAAALAQVPSKDRLIIRLHPSDRVLLEELRNDPVQGHTLIPSDATLMADNSVRKGGCLIETPIGTLDARLETQLALIEQALLGPASNPIPVPALVSAPIAAQGKADDTDA